MTRVNVTVSCATVFRDTVSCATMSCATVSCAVTHIRHTQPFALGMHRSIPRWMHQWTATASKEDETQVDHRDTVGTTAAVVGGGASLEAF